MLKDNCKFYVLSADSGLTTISKEEMVSYLQEPYSHVVEFFRGGNGKIYKFVVL